MDTEPLTQLKGLMTAKSTIGSTTLVTLYVASGQNLWLARDLISTEIKTAVNIKSKQTSKLVISALKMLESKLKLYKETPSNGMVLFAGDFSLDLPTSTNHKSYV